MALPESTRQLVEERIRAFCARRVPPEQRDKFRLGFKIGEFRHAY